MSYKLLGGGSDLNTVISDVNQNILELKNREVTEIFKDSTGQRRVLMGQGANSFYGMKVSKPGFDVYSAPDDQLIFNSGQNTFKIIQTGMVTLPGHSLTAPAGGYTSNQSYVTLTHNLGFVPYVLAYVVATDSSSSAPFPDQGYTASNPGGFIIDWYDLDAFSDSVNFYHNTLGTNNSYTVVSRRIKYYLFQETAL